MRKLVIFFLIAEALDCITTIIGISIGLIELNPIYNNLYLLIGLKIFLVGIVAYALQIKKKMKLDILVPIVAILPVGWNILNILLEI